MKTKHSQQVLEFIKESNAIENVRGQEAFDDSLSAWEYATNGELSLAFICQIHQKIMNRLNPKIAGRLRTNAVYIAGECKDQNITTIIMQVQNWINKHRDATSENDIKNAHIEFEHIHPFADGNGRTGRILLNLQRVKAGLPILIIHEGEEQQEYYQWFTQ